MTKKTPPAEPSPRFVPRATTASGAALPRSHPVVQTDFLRQHLNRGWTERQALERYRAWESGALDASPPIPLLRRRCALSRSPKP